MDILTCVDCEAELKKIRYATYSSIFSFVSVCLYVCLSVCLYFLFILLPP